MSDPSRGKPYVWVTWITAFLAGTDRCKWKPWYKSHFKYAKVPPQPGDSGFNLEQWTRNHDAMTNSRVNRMKLEGYTVRVEEENSFKLDGRNATLSGKPDIVGLRPPHKEALVVDEKSGKKKPEHIWQVLLYMFAMPLTRLKGHVLRGEVEYSDHVVSVGPEQLDKTAEKNIIDIMNVVGGNTPPPRVPSKWECAYCDILHCPDRYQEDDDLGKAVGDASEFF